MKHTELGSIEKLRDLVNAEKVTVFSHESGSEEGAVEIERLTVKKRLDQLENCLATGAECIKDGFAKDMDEEPIRLDSLYVYDAADYLPVKVGNNFQSVIDFIATDEMQSLNGDNGLREWSTVPDSSKEEMKKYEVIDADDLSKREYFTLAELRTKTKEVAKEIGYSGINPEWNNWIDNDPKDKFLEIAELLLEKDHYILNTGLMSEKDIRVCAEGTWEAYGINI